MKDFQTRTTELLEELKASLDNKYHNGTLLNKDVVEEDEMIRQLMKYKYLSSSEKLTLIAIIKHKGDSFATGDIRLALPDFSRVSVSRYIKKLLTLNLINVTPNNTRRYALNDWKIY